MRPNKYRHVIFSTVTGGLLLVGLFLLLNGAPQVARAASGDLFVTPGGGGDCSQAAPCNLQTALGLVSDGDTIYMASGTYTGTGAAVLTVTKSITLYGGWDGAATTPPVRDPDAHLTTIDGEGARRGVYVGGEIAPVLQGVRITRGNAAGLGGYVYAGTTSDAGGGVYVITATVTLADNDIFSNTAQHGAGVVLVNSLGTLDRNTIFSNTTTWGAGGGVFVFKGAPTLKGNAIISNTSSSIGGGLALFSAASSVLNNTIAGNSAGVGGGGVNVASCRPAFSGNLIVDNAAKTGGGIRLWYSRSPLTNNVIADNRATISGSGLWIGGSRLSLQHTTLARNAGGDGSGVFVTVAGRTPSTVILTNTLLAGHSVGISVTVNSVRDGTVTSTAKLEGTLWGSNAWANGTDWGGDGTIVTGTVNIWGDPAFVAPDGGDYNIGPDSTARNAGVNSGVNADIDGHFRPKESGYDIGAYEFGRQWDVFLPLVAKNTP